MFATIVVIALLVYKKKLMGVIVSTVIDCSKDAW